MSMIIGLIVTLLVTAVALIILSKIPGLGIEIDSFGKAITAAIVFGILNALVGPLSTLLKLGPLEWLTWPVLLLINVIVFGLAAKLVQGFRLSSIWSAIVGALGLTILTQVLTGVLASMGLLSVV